MRSCAACHGEVEERFRFCPWCGAPQRLKIVEAFRPHPLLEGDRGRALRVSRYLGGGDDPPHVRFSVWRAEAGKPTAAAAVSLAEDEVERLARFLTDSAVSETTTIA